MPMVLRALRMCDHISLVDEYSMRRVFWQLCYPKWCENKAYWKARKTFEASSNKNVKNDGLNVQCCHILLT